MEIIEYKRSHDNSLLYTISRMNEKLFRKIAACKICAIVFKTQKFVNDCYR